MSRWRRASPSRCSGSRTIPRWRAARERGKEVQVFTSGAVVCRPTQQEADKYFRYFAVEHRDDGAIDTMLNVC